MVKCCFSQAGLPLTCRCERKGVDSLSHASYFGLQLPDLGLHPGS